MEGEFCPARPVNHVTVSPYRAVLAWSDATDCTYVSEMRAVIVAEHILNDVFDECEQGSAVGA